MKYFLYKIYFLFYIPFIQAKNRLYRGFCRTAPILLYHRVDTVTHDPQMLCVTPECFEQHLRFMKKNYDVIPLSVLSERLVQGTLMGNEAAITFDDGYVDNIKNALPLLERYNIPATIFITTSNLGEEASFKWDLDYSRDDRAKFLSHEEIVFISQHPLIEIGAHTHLHIRLAKYSIADQQKEMEKSKHILETIVRREVSTLAYPFGGKFDYNVKSKKAALAAGFRFAYSNTQILAKITKDRFAIPRINIRESTTETLSRKLLTSSKMQ